MRKPILGPTVKVDSSLPCGCNIRRHGTIEFQMWFCSAHANAFEVLDALESSRAALRNVIQHAPSGHYDLALAMEAGMKARSVIRKATRTFWTDADDDA